MNDLKPYSVRCIIRKDGKYLLAVHNYTKPQNRGKWGLVGGHVDETDETIESAARRELREEFYVETHDMKYLTDFEFDNKTHAVCVADTTSDLREYDRNEILEAGWFTLDEIFALSEQRQLLSGLEYDLIQKMLIAEKNLSDTTNA